MTMEPRKTVAAAGFAIGLVALVLQMSLTVPASMETGRSLVASIVYFFSFFTILTNILMVLIYLGALVRGRRWLAFFRKPHTRATAAATITLVGGFYHFVLAGLWHPDGLFAFCDVLLHYVTPAIYLVWFAVWNRTGTLKLPAALTMLAYPFLYLAYVLVRGSVAGEYPYAVLNAGAYGYGQVAMNAAGLLALLLVFNTIAIAIDRSLLAGKRN